MQSVCFWRRPQDALLQRQSSDAEIVFRNQRERLIEFINMYECILGAVAWFTDLKVVNSRNVTGIGAAVFYAIPRIRYCYGE